MGNIINCLQLGHRKAISVKDLSSSMSLFPTSISHNESVIHQMMTYANSRPKPNTTFSWNRVQTMVLEHVVPEESRCTLNNKGMLRAVKKVFDKVNEDLIYYGLRIQNTFVDMDASYVPNFRECSSFSHMKSLTDDEEFKMYLHNIAILKMHQMFIELLIAGETSRVMEIIEMLALSHVLLTVNEFHFRFHSMTMIKFLQKFNLMTAEETTYVIEYMNLMTKKICEFVQSRGNHRNLIDEMTMEEVNMKTTARENYRTLKKWQKLVGDLRNSIEEEINLLLDCQPKNYEAFDVADEAINKILHDCFTRTSKKDYEEQTYELTQKVLDLNFDV